MARVIFFVNRYFLPSTNATARIVSDVVSHVAKNNVKTIVFTGSKAMETKGVIIRRIILPNFDKSRRIHRLLDWFLFQFIVTVKLFFSGTFSAGVFFSTPPFLPLTGMLLKVLKGIPYIAVVQDLYPDVAVAANLIKNGFVVNFLGFLMKIGLSQATYVVVISAGMRDRLIRKGIPEKRIVVIHNWSQVNFCRGKRSKKNIIGYIGNLGIMHDLDRIVSIIKSLCDVRFVFIGSGLKTRVLKEMRLSNVDIVPPVPPDGLNKVMCRFDAGIVSMIPGSDGTLFPTKFIDYIAAGLPVVAVMPEDFEISKIVKEYDIGWVVDKEEDIEILKREIKNSTILERKGRNARKLYEEQFERVKNLDKFTEILEGRIYEY